MNLFASIRGAVADLTGRRQKDLLAALSAQARTARDAMQVALEAATGQLNSTVARERVGELESRGDGHRQEVVSALSRTLVIPIDREDLFRLSRSIDDVLDNLRDFARELDLFGPDVPDECFRPVLEAVGGALDELDAAVLSLADDITAAVAASLRAKKRGNDIRREYQEAVASILDGEINGTTLKRRELLRRLDVVGLRIGEAADALADGGLKRGT